MAGSARAAGAWSNKARASATSRSPLARGVGWACPPAADGPTPQSQLAGDGGDSRWSSTSPAPRPARAPRFAGLPRRAHGASPPTISPRTAGGSRKRTSVLAGWTLTSTSSSGTSRNKRRDRMAVAGEQVAVGGAQRTDQQAVLHRARVDEQILLVGHAAVEGRQADDAGQAEAIATRSRCRCRGGRARG